MFGYFHKVFFSEGTWVFPEGSMLIMMYPYGFFQAFFTYVVSTTLVFSSVFALFAYIVNYRKA